MDKKCSQGRERDVDVALLLINKCSHSHSFRDLRICVHTYIYKKCLAFRRAFDVPSLILAEISQRFFGFGFENFFSLVKR